MKRGFLAVCLCVLMAGTSFAKTIIYLEDGRTVEGEIIEESNTYVRIDLEGVGLTYWLDEIERMETDGVEHNVSTTLSQRFDVEVIEFEDAVEDAEEAPAMPASLAEDERKFSQDQAIVLPRMDLLEESDPAVDDLDNDELKTMSAESEFEELESIEASDEEVPPFSEVENGGVSPKSDRVNRQQILVDVEPQPYKPEFFDARPARSTATPEPVREETEKPDIMAPKVSADKPVEKTAESPVVKLSEVPRKTSPQTQRLAPRPSYGQPQAASVQKSVSKPLRLNLPKIDPVIVQNILRLVFSSSGIIALSVIAVYVLLALCLQIIAAKTSTPHGWLAWLPVANFFLMCKIGRRPLWWLFFFPIPLANIVLLILLWRGIADSCGKPPWIGFLIVIPPGFLFVPLYLAFRR